MSLCALNFGKTTLLQAAMPLGFPKIEMRGKLAIGITANFINRGTVEEEKVQEIR